MKKTTKFVTLIFAVTFFSSFQAEKNSVLTGKWQATSIEAPAQDSMVRAQVKVQLQQIEELDEVDSGMIERYHTSDLATIKKMAKEEVAKQPEQMKQQIKDAAAAFSFELMKDGRSVTFGERGADTATWYLGDNGKKLFLDPFEVKSNNTAENKNVMIFDIIYQSNDSLRLRVHQQIGQDVFVNMIRNNNKKKN